MVEAGVVTGHNKRNQSHKESLCRVSGTVSCLVRLRSCLRNLQAAAAEINVFGNPRGLRSFEDPFVEAVNNEAAFLFSFHEARVAENSQVVRDGDDLQFQTVGQFAHVQRAGPQRVDDFDADRVAESTQLFGAMIRLEWVRLQWIGSHVIAVEWREEMCQLPLLEERIIGTQRAALNS